LTSIGSFAGFRVSDFAGGGGGGSQGQGPTFIIVAEMLIIRKKYRGVVVSSSFCFWSETEGRLSGR